MSPLIGKPSSCPQCFEIPGFIVTDDPGNGAPRTLAKCPHRTGALDPGVLLRRAGVPERELAYTYDGLTPSQKAALGDLERSLSDARDVLLVGPNGSGKTGVCVIALQHAAARQQSVGYAYVRTLLSEIRESFNNREGTRSEEEIIASLVAPEVLLLDDLPEEQVSPHVRTTVLQVLHRRRGYVDRRTLVTSNPDLEPRRVDRALPTLDAEPALPSIEELYGSGIADRLREYRRIVLDAESRRRERAKPARKLVAARGETA